MINEWHEKTLGEIGMSFYGLPVVHPMRCKDGFEVSVQASSIHYCVPRSNNAHPYKAFELGYPSEKDDLIMEYAEDPENPTGTVYAYVPVEVVEKLVEKHGGIFE